MRTVEQLVKQAAHRNCLFYLVPILISSCRDGGQVALTTGAMVRDSAGIRIVESRDPAWLPAEAWRIADTPSLSIGTVDGAPEQQLANVRGVVELDDGRIVVANAGSLEIRCYRSDGSWLWSSGRRGQGPGDFQSFYALTRYRGDSLLVHDFSLRRYTILDSIGRFARTMIPNLPEDVTFSGSLGFLGVWDDGSIAISEQPVRRGMSPPQVTRRPTRLFRYSATGVVLARLAQLPGSEFFEGTGVIGSIRLLPWGRNSHYATVGARTYAGDGDRYEIRRLGSDGTIELIIRRALPPRLVTSAEADAERQRLLQARREERPRMFRGMPDSILSVIAANEDKLLGEIPFPPTHPAYDQLLVDREELLWVREFNPRADTLSAGRRWSIFDPNGRWLGDVQLPPRFTLYEATAEHVLGVQIDDLDVQYVRAFRIERPRRER